MKKTLLVGATGLLGPDICRQLTTTGHHVRALIRRTANAEKRAELERLGVEGVEGDLKDAPSLARACGGVEAVISTASSMLSRQDGDSIETVDQRGQRRLSRRRGRPASSISCSSPSAKTLPSSFR